MLSKSQARTFFIGGTAVTFLAFIGLTVYSLNPANDQTNHDKIDAKVVRGKEIWENNNCMGCHTIMGEGAYYAPELGNVWVRYGGKEDASGARDALKAWMKGQPSGIEGRRQMPQFNLSETELDNLVDFLKWTSEVDTQNWPPKVSG